jgi:hypothetical protein
MKKFLSILSVAFLVAASASSQTISGTFAIQNTVTGKNLRPYEAGSNNGNRIVLYNHVEWKCMTWNFINVNDNTYQLRNLFTSKTFQPKETPVKSGSALEQQPLSSSQAQQWEFLKTAENNYLIRLRGTELYITASSDQTNSDIILQEKKAGSLQIWRLVAQNPTM